MATNFLELATILKYLGAKWLWGKKVNFTPCGGVSYVWIVIAQNAWTSSIIHKRPSGQFACERAFNRPKLEKKRLKLAKWG